MYVLQLTSRTHRYRFVELYYRRAESVHRGRVVPARVETVVVYVPDVWSCLPTRLEWDALVPSYAARPTPAVSLDQALLYPSSYPNTPNKQLTNRGRPNNKQPNRCQIEPEPNLAAGTVLLIGPGSEPLQPLPTCLATITRFF